MDSRRLSIFSLLFICLQTGFGFAEDFGYSEKNGPNHWGEKFKGCVGKHQSPIDISDNNVSPIKLGDISFSNFREPPEEVTITNNGHTVMLRIRGKKLPEVSGGPLKGTYKFSQLHFHWGENDLEGSENKINNHSFPMELHMVFYKTSYGNASNAMLHSDGLTVLAFLYKVSRRNNTNYNGLISALEKVRDPGLIANVDGFSNLDSLLMYNRNEYFTYDGSLTTPPCSEVVIWIEFKNAISLSHAQLEEFRNLNNEDGKMTHNFRPTQPIHDRVIYYNGGTIKKITENIIPTQENKNKNNKKSSGNTALENSILMIFAIMISSLNYY